MSERRTNAERSRSTRARLLDAAQHLFARQGYAPTSMTDVATHAGLSTGALYHHWPTKQQLLAGVVGSLQHDLADAIAPDNSEGTDPLEQLHRAASGFLGWCADHDGALLLLVDGPAVLGEAWDGLDRRWWQQPIENVLRHAHDLGILTDCDPALLATGLRGTLTALGRTVAANPDRRYAANQVLRALINGLRR